MYTNLVNDALVAAHPALAADLELRFRAGARHFRLITGDRVVALQSIRAAAQALGPEIQVVRFDAAAGWTPEGDPASTVDLRGELRTVAERLKAQSDPELRTVVANVIRAIPEFEAAPSAFVVLENLHPFLATSPLAVQALLNLDESRLTRDPIDRAIILLATTDATFPPPIEATFAALELPMPDETAMLVGPVALAERSVAMAGGESELDDALRRDLARTCLGLGRAEATAALAASAVARGRLDRGTLADLRREKGRLLRASKALVPIADEELVQPEDLVGIGAVLEKMRLASQAYSDEGLAARVPAPRGLVLAGLAGTGKTSAALAAPAMFRRHAARELPLVRFDVGSLFGRYLGDSEAAWRQARDVLAAQAHSGVLVVVDEAGRALGGMAGAGGEGDSGTGARIFGEMLNFFEQAAAREWFLYPVFTMNNPELLPPEFLARADGCFFFDLPSRDALVDILRVHLDRLLRTRMGLTHEAVGLSPAQERELAGLMHGFVGRDVAKAVGEASRLAFDHTRTTILPSYVDLRIAIVAQQGSVGSIVDGRRVEELRQICRSYTRADAPIETRETAATRNGTPTESPEPTGSRKLRLSQRPKD
jgi:hypothetical protein